MTHGFFYPLRMAGGAMHTLLRLIAGVLVAMCAATMAHAEAGPGVLTATSITSTSATTSGLSGTLNAVLAETERRSYYSTRVTVGWGTIGAAGKAAFRGASRFIPYVGLAMTAAEMSGWEFDGSWFNKGDGIPNRELQGGVYWCARQQDGFVIAGTYCSDSQTEMRAWLLDQVIVQGGMPYEVTEVVESWGNLLARHVDNGTLLASSVAPMQYDLPTQYKTPGSREPTPVTETEMAQAMASNAQNHHSLLHDINGNPHQFPEVQTALNNMALGIGAASGTGQAPTVDGDPVDPNNEDGNSPDPTGNPGKGSELPAFCEWAKVVCDFIEWYKDEGEPLEPVELPEADEEDPTQHWSSGQGGGSCPAPQTLTVMGQDLEFSYAPICDFADVIRALVLVMSSILAVRILAGAAR